MSRRPPGPDVQRAVEFLSNAGLASGRTPLAERPDYRCLARRASELGYDVSPEAVEEAFRAIVRARLVVLSRLSGGGAR